MTTNFSPSVLKSLEAMVAGSDALIAQSDRRLLTKAAPTIAEIRMAAKMRQFAAGDDPVLKASAHRWLASRGLPVREKPTLSSPKAARVTARLIDLVQKANRQGWTKARRQAEIRRIVDREFTTRST